MLDNNLYLEKLGAVYNFTYNDVNVFGLDTTNGHIGLPTISSSAKIYLSTNVISDELIRFAYGNTNYTAIRVNNNGELNFSNKIIFAAGSADKAGGLQVQPGLLKSITSVADTGSIEFDGFNFYFINILGNRQTFGVSNATTVHSELTSLQGGVSGQYYHLTLYQYNTVINLSDVSTNGVVRKNNNTFTASSITWDEISNKPPTIPPVAGNQNKYLTTDGINLAWGTSLSNNDSISTPFKQTLLIAGSSTIDSTNADNATAIEYILTARNNVTGDIKTCKMIVTSCKNDVFYTEYTQILSNDNDLVVLYEFIFNSTTKDIELNATTLSNNITIEGYKEIINNLERTFEFIFTTSSLDTVTLDYTLSNEATTVEYILLARDTDTDNTKTCKFMVVNVNNDVFYTEYAQILSNDNDPIVIFDAVFNINLQRIELTATPCSDHIIIEGFKEILN
jgi:hypothetical protein